MKYPKVLIISTNFTAGDAISQLNFFKNWSPENLYCLSSSSGSVYASRFAEYYVLGNSEIKVPLIYSFFERFAPSKVISNCNHIENLIEKNSITYNNKSLKRKIYNSVVSPLLKYFDLYDMRYRVKLSDNIIQWIEKNRPDIIYSSVGNIQTARLLLEIMRRFPKIKYVIHGFDDWTHSNYPLAFKRQYIKKRKKELKKILSVADLKLSTTDKMAEDYHKFFGGDFTTFYNPADLSRFVPTKESELKKDHYKHIVYVGKIANHNAQAIKDVIDVIDKMNAKNQEEKIVLDIYTSTPLDLIQSYDINNSPNCIFHNPVPNSEIPEILMVSDALFLPITISKGNVGFTRYSQSTKMGEYMASGKPIFYYGPEGIAMTEMFEKFKTAIIVKSRFPFEIEKGLLKLFKNDREIKGMINRALKISQKEFDLSETSNRFERLFIGLINN